MSQSSKALYHTKHIRLCEQKALADLGITDDELMTSAGIAAFDLLKNTHPNVRSIAVFCGAGNNAGDGYVLARLAFEAQWSVIVYQCKAVDDLPATAKHAAVLAIAAGVSCQCLDDVIDGEVELIVDALLGIGIQGTVHGPIAQAITLINESGLPVLSLDIPSGLDADTGCALGACVHASTTLTFIAHKIGLYTADGPDYCGQIVCHDLKLSHCLSTMPPLAYTLDALSFQGILQPRPKNSHKGCYGHVLLIGGGLGMPGAIHLAAMAALRVGAGAVTVATRPDYADHALASLPEVMIYGVEDGSSLLPLLAKATVCVIGPGLGDSAWAHSLFSAVVAAQLPLVLDASALRMLAEHPQHDDNWVLTPHPGEAAHLLGCSVADIQHHRSQAAMRIQQVYGGCVVLKGAGTIIYGAASDMSVCTAGNPGMASAGMGDVLSGMIGGLLAQGLALSEASTLGAWLHASAADEAVMAQGERGLIASDLMPYLRRQLNALR